MISRLLLYLVKLYHLFVFVLRNIQQSKVILHSVFASYAYNV